MKNKAILIGYGNPARLDDGLGPALVARLEASPVEGLVVESDFQLAVEHALEISNYEVAVFADASAIGEPPFTFEKLVPANQPAIGSHDVSPRTVFALARTMFRAKTDCFLLGIRGYEFNGLGESLSEGAKKNLDSAYEFIKDLQIMMNNPG